MRLLRIIKVQLEGCSYSKRYDEVFVLFRLDILFKKFDVSNYEIVLMVILYVWYSLV